VRGEDCCPSAEILAPILYNISGVIATVLANEHKHPAVVGLAKRRVHFYLIIKHLIARLILYIAALSAGISARDRLIGQCFPLSVSDCIAGFAKVYPRETTIVRSSRFKQPMKTIPFSP
jgi:hypothetical protein